ncbi:MAG: shikimate dehydrogenase (NADP(+)) [Fimbriimonadales bacterium]|nr:MAG: shikimate dehydrogenase (NADP(+)) [Fimbriimonadales bacterium]
MINAETRLAGVLGYPVRHSLSPTMHNAAFQALGLNWVYLAFEVPPDALPQAVAGMRGLRIQGLNLTIPHKEAVIPLLDHLTDAAQQMGAVNTLFWEGERLVGDNTDAEGFLQALREEGIEPVGQTILVLGAGGAARAVAYALHRQGCRLWIANRTLERAEMLAQAFHATPIAMTHDTLRTLIPQLDGVVNCTSLGMSPDTDSSPPMDWEALPDTAWACDLVYRPLRTRFLQDAQKHGIRTIDGLGMLIHQGALAFERWTGQPAPLSVMREAAMQALKG